MTDSEKIDIENKQLLIQNQKLTNIIYDTDILHYKRIDLQSVLKLNKKLKRINKKLVDKVHNIYDI